MLNGIQAVFFPLHEHRAYSCMSCLIDEISTGVVNPDERLAKNLSMDLGY